MALDAADRIGYGVVHAVEVPGLFRDP